MKYLHVFAVGAVALGISIMGVQGYNNLAIKDVVKSSAAIGDSTANDPITEDEEDTEEKPKTPTENTEEPAVADIDERGDQGGGGE